MQFYWFKFPLHNHAKNVSDEINSSQFEDRIILPIVQNVIHLTHFEWV